MTDQLYCLSDPDEPGLVRVALRRNIEAMPCGFHDMDICRPGECIDWSLKVRNADTALRALHNTMCRYRKNRGNGVYRCSSREARDIAARYTVRNRPRWSLQSLLFGDAPSGFATLRNERTR